MQITTSASLGVRDRISPNSTGGTQHAGAADSHHRPDRYGEPPLTDTISTGVVRLFGSGAPAVLDSSRESDRH
jgi:hypothetical protein